MIICDLDNFLHRLMNNNDDPQDQADDAKFYSNDVQAAAMADNKMNSDDFSEEEEIPVTSGDMKIGDLDDDAMEGRGGEESYDEESVPAGDNVVDN